MDEFDFIISEDHEAKVVGDKEAWEFYKQQYMPKKAYDDGYYLGNEIQYYRGFVEQVLLHEDLFKNSKIAKKKIVKLLKKLNEIENQKDMNRQKEMKQEFQLILQLLQIEFKSTDKDDMF